MLIWLALGGVTLVHRFAELLRAQESATNVVLAELVGRTAQVTIAIPAEGVGEITLLAFAEQTSQLARSVDGTPIPFGRDVVVRAVRDGQVLVSSWR